MGLFGGLATAAKRFATPETLMLVGATLKDASAGGSDNLLAVQQMQAQRQKLAQQREAGQSIAGLFGGGMTGQGPDAASAAPMSGLPQLTDPNVQRRLLAAQQMGYDIRPVVDMLKAGQPDIAIGPDGRPYSKNDAKVLSQRFAQPTVVNGVIVDQNDPVNLERHIPQLGEGMTYQRDASGRAVGVQNAPGYVDALGQATEARQIGQTRGTMFKVPRQGGGDAMMTGGQYLTSGQTVPGLGLSQTPAEAAAANARATAQAGAQISLPQNMQMADQALSVIDQLKKDPALGSRTGMLGAIPAIPGTAGADFDAKVAQLKGKLFMEAYAGLKGGGQITEVEGRKATEAIGRLNTTQTKAGFIAALDDLASVIEAGKQRAAAQAGASAPARTNVRPARSDIEAEMRRRGLLK